MDYRRLNSVTQGSDYPILSISNVLDAVSQGKVFAKCNLVSGYWQIPIRQSDQHKTAFCTHLGLYDFIRLPFGLKTAPNTFQRISNTVFADFLHKWVVAVTDEEALAFYSLLFQRLVKVGFSVYILRKGNRNTGTSHHPGGSNTHKQRSKSNLIYAHTKKRFCSQTFHLTFWIFQGLYLIYVYSYKRPAKSPQEGYIISMEGRNRKRVSRLEGSNYWPRCHVVLS